jgi:hypothetical protein
MKQLLAVFIVPVLLGCGLTDPEVATVEVVIEG